VAKAIFTPARHNDWDWAQVQYESTDLSTTDIATIIGVTPTALIARASNRGWTRNKGKLVAQYTAELVLANREREAEARQQKLAVIERVNAEMQANVLTTHRKDIKQARNICGQLFDELAVATPGDDDSPIAHLDTKSRVLSRLADSMKTLMLLERQAYGIQGVFEDLDKPPPAPTEQGQVDAVMSKFAAVLAKRMGGVEVVHSDAGN
jgi:hypothetical protein